MKRFFPITRMSLEAQFSPKRRGILSDFFIFYLSFWIISFLQSIVISIPQILHLFTNAEFRALLESDIVQNGDTAAITEAFAAILAEMPWWLMPVSLFSTAVLVPCAIFIAVKIDRRPVSSMGIHRRGAVSEYLMGLGIGVLLFGGAVAIALLSDAVTLAVNPAVQIGVLLLYFFAFLVQGFAEEVLCRGYFMMTLSQSNSPVTAVIGSSLAFALIHSSNAGSTPLALLNVGLAGALFGIYMWKRGSIWGAAAIHSIWNFMQGNIFGIPVSGNVMTSSLFTVTQDTLKQHVHGGEFGLEGGLAVTIVLLVGIGIFVGMPAKKSEIATWNEIEETERPQ